MSGRSRCSCPVFRTCTADNDGYQPSSSGSVDVSRHGKQVTRARPSCEFLMHLCCRMCCDMTHLLHAVHAWSVLPAVQPQSIQGLPAGTLSHDFTFLGFVIIMIIIIIIVVVVVVVVIMIMIMVMIIIIISMILLIIIMILIIMMMIIIIMIIIIIIMIIIFRVSVRNDLSFLGLVILNVHHQHYRTP